MPTLTKEQRSWLESQASRYQNNLYLAADYLEGRGLTEDTAVSARLGVVDEPLSADADAEGNRLSIPYLTRSGVVDIRYRCLRPHSCDEEGCSKYLTRAGQPPRLYGVGDLVSAGDWICVTEGELDRLTLVQLGYPAVGIPGAESWKPHWRRLFEDFSRIVVFCDGDDAGARFGRNWSGRFPQTVEVVQLDHKQDVNLMYTEGGRDFFDRILLG